MSSLVYRRGDRGRIIADLQSVLGVAADGIYGPRTEAAVRSFQQARGLVVDGVAGMQTLTAAGVYPVAGLDVSGWQEPLDWHRVYGAGYRYVWVKATEGQTFLSKAAKGHVDGAHAAGLKVGAYHFATASSSAADAKAEAAWFAAAMLGLGPLDLPPVLDIESDPARLTTKALTAWCEVFCSELTRLVGRRPVVYTYKAFLGEFGDGGVLRDYPLWIARYTSANDPGTVTPWPTWLVWQHGIQEVPGAKGKVDVNWLAGGPDALRRLCEWR